MMDIEHTLSLVHFFNLNFEAFLVQVYVAEPPHWPMQNPILPLHIMALTRSRAPAKSV